MPVENVKSIKPATKAPPDPHKLINLVKEIPKEKQKEIARVIVEDTDNDITSRSDWAEKQDRAYKLYTLHRKTKTIPWVNCSNVCLPLLSTAVNQFHGRAYQSIFGAPGLVKALPTSKNDVINARNVEDYMDWQLKYEMEEYEEVMDKLLLNLPINGTAFKKVIYSGKLARPVSDYIGALDLILPYKTKSLETARRITHRLELHWDDLLDRFDQKIYLNQDDFTETAGEDDKEESLRTTADEVAGITASENRDKPHIIYESHRKWNLGDGRKPYIFTVDKDTQTLTRAVSRRFKSGADMQTLNYFIDYHFIPNSEGFYSFGFAHFLEVLNEMANRAFNIIFDSGSLTNQPFGFYGRRAGFKEKKIKLEPGFMGAVEDATQVYFPNMQRVDQTLFMVLGLIGDYAANFTSVTEAILGRERKGVERPTARGTQSLIEQGLTTFSAIVKRVYRGMRKEFLLIKQQNEIFLSDTKEYRVTGNIEKIAFKDIKRGDFAGVKDIVPVADPSFASKQVRRQEAMQLHEITMSNPLVSGTPPPKEGGEPAIKPNLRAMAASTKNLYAAFEEPRTEELIAAIEEVIPPPTIPPDEENSMFVQGDYTSPQFGENHILHMQTHRHFMITKPYKDMRAEYKPFLTEHIKETQLTAQIEINQQAQQAQQETAAPQEGPPQNA